MRPPHTDGWTRRRFLGGLTLAGTAGLLGLPARPVAAGTLFSSQGGSNLHQYDLASYEQVTC